MMKVLLGEYDDNYSLKILNKGKTYWKTTRLGEKIIIGNDKLDDAEVIDKNGIEDMGPEKFIKQLWEHVIGGIS